jgi:hypothetical protein
MVDIESYGKFLKMLKSGVPRMAVEMKMKQEGLDISYLDMESNVPNSEGGFSTTVPGIVPLKSDPDYGKFLKMLKSGVPRMAVEMKVRQAGLDVCYLDKNPDLPRDSMTAPKRRRSTTHTTPRHGAAIAASSGLSPAEVETLFRVLDADGSGSLTVADLDEFHNNGIGATWARNCVLCARIELSTPAPTHTDMQLPPEDVLLMVQEMCDDVGATEIPFVSISMSKYVKRMFHHVPSHLQNTFSSRLGEMVPDWRSPLEHAFLVLDPGATGQVTPHRLREVLGDFHPCFMVAL